MIASELLRTRCTPHVCRKLGGPSVSERLGGPSLSNCCIKMTFKTQFVGLSLPPWHPAATTRWDVRVAPHPNYFVLREVCIWSRKMLSHAFHATKPLTAVAWCTATQATIKGELCTARGCGRGRDVPQNLQRA